MSAGPEIIVIIGSIIALFILYKYLRSALVMRQIEEFTTALAKGETGRRLYLKGEGGFPKIISNLSVIAASMQEKTAEADQARQRMDALLGCIPDGIAVIDMKNRLKYANSSFERLFHFKPEDLGRKGIEDLSDISGLDRVVERSREANCGQTETFPLNSQYIEITSLPFSQEGPKYAGSLLIFRDVTAIKRIDEIRRDFVANVSHELKTPVTAIKGYAETLVEGALDDRENALKFLEIIKFQSERMERLVRDLITLSAIESGAVPMEIKRVHLPALVDSAVSGYEERAHSKNIRIIKDVRKECEFIEADPERLTQILTNLLSNAVKYTESGEISVLARPRENYRCVLTVQDTGIGIPKKFIPRLGERFFRVDPSRSRELGGTGLGLAIVKHLVMAHGWKMHMESEPGVGTAVRIYIP